MKTVRQRTSWKCNCILSVQTAADPLDPPGRAEMDPGLAMGPAPRVLCVHAGLFPVQASCILLYKTAAHRILQDVPSCQLLQAPAVPQDPPGQSGPGRSWKNRPKILEDSRPGTGATALPCLLGSAIPFLKRQTDPVYGPRIHFSGRGSWRRDSRYGSRFRRNADARKDFPGATR